jgi:hypothetical protein
MGCVVGGNFAPDHSPAYEASHGSGSFASLVTCMLRERLSPV